MFFYRHAAESRPPKNGTRAAEILLQSPENMNLPDVTCGKQRNQVGYGKGCDVFIDGKTVLRTHPIPEDAGCLGRQVP